MQQSKHTKRALTASVLSMFLCVVLLIGATFAWFTDSVTSGRNRIVAGNLDVELEYATGFAAGADLTEGTVTWNSVEDETELFEQGTLWEPGHAEVVYLRVRNNGTLALKYQLAMNILAETTAENVAGQEFQLSDYLMYGVVENQRTAFTDRTAALTAAADNTAVLDAYSKTGNLNAGDEPQYLALVVYMPESVGNEANYRGTQEPAIDLGVTLMAAQDTVEADSFDNTYDTDAMYDNGNGIYTNGNELYVNVNNQYILVTADASVSGLYTDAEGNNYVAGADAVKKVFAAAEDGENIIFIDDVTISSIGSDTYVTAENVTIDLNGYTVSVDYGTGGNAFSVTGDGSVVKNGTFTCTGNRADYPLWITGNTGRAKILVENVVVEGGMQVTGTVEATLRNVTVTANTWYDVYLAQDSRVTVESGTFTNTGTRPHFYIFNYSSRYNPTVTINGGEFSGGSPTYAVQNSNYGYTFTNNISGA